WRRRARRRARRGRHQAAIGRRRGALAGEPIDARGRISHAAESCLLAYSDGSLGCDARPPSKMTFFSMLRHPCLPLEPRGHLRAWVDDQRCAAVDVDLLVDVWIGKQLGLVLTLNQARSQPQILQLRVPHFRLRLADVQGAMQLLEVLEQRMRTG